jgi:RNA recognition motif-containing protein
MKFTSEELNELFSEIGYLTKCKLVLDDFGKSKGRAVVIYENPRDAERAIEKFNDNKLDNKIIAVEFAPGRKEPPRGFSGHDSRLERPSRRDRKSWRRN